MRQPNWSSIAIYETIDVWTGIAVPLCVLGAALVGWGGLQQSYDREVEMFRAVVAA